MRVMTLAAALSLLAVPALAQTSNPTPPATNTVMGKVKPGTGCSITTPGVIDCSGGGGGSPASPDTSLQFNNSGAFGGTSLLWDGTGLTSAATPGTSMLMSAGEASQAIPGLEIGGTSGYFGLSIVASSGQAGEPALALVGYGSGNYPLPSVNFANGVVGAPTAVLNGDRLVSDAVFGYADTTFKRVANIIVDAAEDFTDTATGVVWTLQTSAIGSSTAIERIEIDGSGNINALNGGFVVGTPTGGSQGVGTVIAAGGFFTDKGAQFFDDGNGGANIFAFQPTNPDTGGNSVTISATGGTGTGGNGGVTIQNGNGGSGGSAGIAIHALDGNIAISADAGATIITGGGLTVTGGPVSIGATASLVASDSELAFTKISATGTAPGAGNAKVEWVAGTNAGTCKLISYAGTSATPVTIVDNVGTGC